MPELSREDLKQIEKASKMMSNGRKKEVASNVLNMVASKSGNSYSADASNGFQRQIDAGLNRVGWPPPHFKNQANKLENEKNNDYSLPAPTAF